MLSRLPVMIRAFSRSITIHSPQSSYDLNPAGRTLLLSSLSHSTMGKVTFRERLRYKTDQFFQSGFTLQLVISAVVLVAVITVFFIISEILAVQPGPDFDVPPGAADPFWPSTRFWWVVMHVMESYWVERTTLPQVLSLLMTMFNLIVFAAFIGLFGSRIQQRLEQVRRGTTRVLEQGHIVIIGWSGKVLPIMRELHEGLESVKPVFVLQTESSLDEIDGRLKREFGRRCFRWVIRQGSMTDMKDLELLNIPQARTVVILSQQGDAQVIKSIMAVTHLVKGNQHNDRKPLLIAEVNREAMLRLARAAALDLDISIVQPAEYLSRIILQTARQQGLVNVYNEILSHYANELHFTRPGALAGKSWLDASFSFPKAVPLGIIRDEVPMLAPSGSEDEMSIRKDDVILCIARSDVDMLTDRTPAHPSLPPNARPNEFPQIQQVRNLLILGWNEKAEPLLAEYARYAHTIGSSFSATIISEAIPDYLSPRTAVAHSTDTLSVEFLRSDALQDGVLESVDPKAYDAIVILGEQRSRDTAEDADTRVIMLLLLLRSMRDHAERTGRPFPANQQIVSEILDASNKDLAESTGTMQDVIISNALVSKMIAQICRDPRTEAVMRDFFDEEGKEIYLKHAAWYTAIGSEVAFGQLRRAALMKDEIAIGIAQKTDVDIKVEINPDMKTAYRIDARSFLIVISEHEELSWTDGSAVVPDA
jgi:ion channel POLLUX/CASTOR